MFLKVVVLLGKVAQKIQESFFIMNVFPLWSIDGTLANLWSIINEIWNANIFLVLPVSDGTLAYLWSIINEIWNANIFAGP